MPVGWGKSSFGTLDLGTRKQHLRRERYQVWEVQRREGPWVLAQKDKSKDHVEV